MGQGWLTALKEKVLRDKNMSLLCQEILQKDCSECPSFLNKVSLFLSKKPVYYLPCPKLEMQNASFTAEVLSIKSRGTMQNLKWIEQKQFRQGIYWHILVRHPTLLTDTQIQIQSYICAWSQDRQNISFLQNSISLFPSSVDLRQRFRKQDCIEVGSSMCLKCWHISTQPMAWLSLHSRCGFSSFSFSLFSLSNDFFDHSGR